jgi:hypothetical protein
MFEMHRPGEARDVNLRACANNSCQVRCRCRRYFVSSNSGFENQRASKPEYTFYTATCTLFCFVVPFFVLTDALQLTMLIPRFLRHSQAPLTSLTRSHSFLYKSFASTSWRSRSTLQADEDTLSKLPGLDASKLSITKTTTPKKIGPPEELVFGRSFTGLFVGAASPVRMLLIQSPS